MKGWLACPANTFSLLGVLALFVSVDLRAFDNKECARTMVAGGGEGLIVSTASFVSSTGECSINGSVEEKRKTFFVVNYEQILLDFSRGSGSYGQSLASLYGLDASAYAKVAGRVKANYSQIFGAGDSHDLESMFENLDGYFAGVK